MTAAEDREAPAVAAPVITQAWRELWAWACAQRADWDPVRVQGVLIGCKQAAVPYEDAARVTWRLAWDLTMSGDDAIAELRRLHGKATSGHMTPEAREALMARIEAARGEGAAGEAVPEARGSP